MIFYCKAYCKVGNDKKGYSETISKPSYLLKEKEKEIFLNGEVKEHKKTTNFGGQTQKVVKRTFVCLKALQVDDQLAREAIRNVLTKNSIGKH